jgi:hypothetical protein
MWGTDVILGNARETKKTTAVVKHQMFNKQQFNYNNIVTVRNVVFCLVRVEVL